MVPVILIAFLEMGWVPQGSGIINYQPLDVFVISQATGYVELGFDAELIGFHAGGSVRTIIELSRSQNDFWPVGVWYTFSVGWRNDWIDIGYRHRCDHPVVAYPIVMGTPKWDSGWEEIYARVTLRMSQ